MEHNNQFLKEQPSKLFLSYLIPSICATLVTSIYILADTMMIGKGVGAVGIAALNLLLPVFSVYVGTGILFGVGGSVLFSVSKGRGEEKKAREYFTAAVLLAALMSLVYMWVFTAFFDPITLFLGRNEGTDTYVREYGKYLKLTPAIFLFSSFLQAFVRNDGAPKLAMAAVITGGVTNVFLDYYFIFSRNWGIGGAAFATVLGYGLTTAILCVHFFSKKNTLKLVRTEGLAHKCLDVVRHGFSSFLLEESNGVIMLLFNRQLLSYVGDLGVVVYGIVSNSALVVTSINNGISQASQPILAVNYGAGEKKRVALAMKYGVITAILFGMCFTAVGLLFPAQITSLFVDPTPEIMEMAVKAVRIYFLSFLPLGVNMLCSTYLQCVMRPADAMAICFLRGFLLSSVLVLVLPVLFGVDGIWAVMAVTEMITLAVAIFFWKKASR
ncbi:MAG: MATE family efflux transporter [Lachnospiraceae bacterium]